MSIKILIVDDHQIVLDGMNLMLQDHPEITVIAQANDGKEAIEFVEEHDVDVVLMDLNMPKVNGMLACKRIKKLKPNTKVLILSMISEHKMIQKLMEVGANGYMLKNSGQKEITKAILEVYQGHNYFDQRIIKMKLRPEKFKQVKDEKMHPSLSRREREILKLIVEEHTTKEISDKLFITFGTVESHRRNMINKLGVRNTAGLVGAAFKLELVS